PCGTAGSRRSRAASNFSPLESVACGALPGDIPFGMVGRHVGQGLPRWHGAAAAGQGGLPGRAREEHVVSSGRRGARREHWVAAAAGLLARGRNLAEVSLTELEKEAGATRGSLYTYFPTMGGLHQAVIAWWREQRSQAALDATIRSVASPLERLRL